MREMLMDEGEDFHFKNKTQSFAKIKYANRYEKYVLQLRKIHCVLWWHNEYHHMRRLARDADGCVSGLVLWQIWCIARKHSHWNILQLSTVLYVQTQETSTTKNIKKHVYADLLQQQGTLTLESVKIELQNQGAFLAHKSRKKKQINTVFPDLNYQQGHNAAEYSPMCLVIALQFTMG